VSAAWLEIHFEIDTFCKSFWSLRALFFHFSIVAANVQILINFAVPTQQISRTFLTLHVPRAPNVDDSSQQNKKLKLK
jgi:hypothetical protein